MPDAKTLAKQQRRAERERALADAIAKAQAVLAMEVRRCTVILPTRRGASSLTAALPGRIGSGQPLPDRYARPDQGPRPSSSRPTPSSRRARRDGGANEAMRFTSATAKRPS